MPAFTKCVEELWIRQHLGGFPGGSDGKESPCNAGDLGSIPEGGHGNPVQYSCLENPMDRGDWRATFIVSQRVRHNWTYYAHMPYLPTQETWVRSLVQEGPTCCRAIEPIVPQILSLCSRAREPQLLKLSCLEIVPHSKTSHCSEKPTHRPLENGLCSLQVEKKPAQQWRPSTAINK